MSETVNDNNKQGFFWHVHHGILVEWCHSCDERIEYICIEKPLNERETRLRLFQPAKGNLPEEIIETWRACDKARQAFDIARRARDEAWLAYVEAYQAYDKARQAYYVAINKNMSKIKALHAEECPNCPWNGHTIFPKA